jgi:nicotinate-nucleotide pyrophosphorylase (carboxylating)
MNYFADLPQNVQQALHEDVGSGDLTADLIPQNAQATAKVIAKEPAVVCGRPWFDAVFQSLTPDIDITWHCEEGDRVENQQLICTLQGSARAILTGERSALNFLQTLSGTASTTALYVAALQRAGQTHTQLLDTRKTLPGLRLAQKYAVKCGGGTNHRIGLYDALLIKENHIFSAGDLTTAVQLAKKQHPGKIIEVETENLDEVKLAVMAGADIIMLDNFSIEEIKVAVNWVREFSDQVKLEASGNVELSQLAALAETGVDFISTGAITKHLHAIDYSMRFEFNQ